MDYTMLKQMARLCRLLALLHDNESVDSATQAFASILESNDSKTKSPMTKELSGLEIALFLSKAPKMYQHEYQLVKQYLNTMGSPYRSHTDYPHPEYALILPPNAKRLTEFHDNGCTYSCSSSHSGNSPIQFYNRETQAHLTGVIDTILEIPLEGFLRKFILVHPYCDLNEEDTRRTPYSQFPRMMTKAVDTTPSGTMIVIEPQHIITHLTTYKRPAGTFGIDKEILIICWALNRGRR